MVAHDLLHKGNLHLFLPQDQQDDPHHEHRADHLLEHINPRGDISSHVIDADQHEHHQDILYQQDAQYILPHPGVDNTLLIQHLHDHRRTADADHESEKDRIGESEIKIDPYQRYHPDAHRHLEQRTQDGDAPVGNQLGQVDLHADKKQEQHQSQVTQVGDQLFVGNQVETKRSDDHPHQDVGDYRRLVEQPQQETHHDDHQGQDHKLVDNTTRTNGKKGHSASF